MIYGNSNVTERERQSFVNQIRITRDFILKLLICAALVPCLQCTLSCVGTIEFMQDSQKIPCLPGFTFVWKLRDVICW